MSALELGEARRAGTKALADYYGEEIEDSSYSLDARVAIRAAAPLIEAQIRASIAAEFDTLAGMLTDAMERTTVPIDLAICQDRRAQMATAEQMVRGRVAP